MYVVGFASTSLGPGAPPGRTPMRPSATTAWARPLAFDPNVAPVRFASSSRTIWPTLWRFSPYFSPGVARPPTPPGSAVMLPPPGPSSGKHDARHRQERYRASEVLQGGSDLRRPVLRFGSGLGHTVGPRLRCASAQASAAAADAADCDAAISDAAASAARSSAEACGTLI